MHQQIPRKGLSDMALTDRQIRAAKPTGKKQTLSDGGGLSLVVTPAGGKYWQYNFRHDGKMSRPSDKYGAAARINLNALSASKFKAQSQRGMREILSLAVG